MLHKCSVDTTLTNRLLDGYIFDKLERNDKLFQYIIYLPELKLTKQIDDHKKFRKSTNV